MSVLSQVINFMRKTEAKYGSEARDKLFKGVRKVYDGVAHTMGARGRNAIYQKYGMPIVTNDGISIAREIIPADPYEYLGAETIKQASERTNDDAGDGTTGTIVVGQHLLHYGREALDKGINPMVLRKELEEAKQKAVASLKEKSTPVTDLKQVAMISVEDEKLSEMVSGIVESVGKEGTVLVSESNGTEIRSETMKGYTWQQGYVSPYMVTNQRGEAVLEDAAVIVTDKNLNLNSQLITALQTLGQEGMRNVVVISPEFDGELLQTAIANKQQGNMNIVAVKAPGSYEELEDIATVTGATAITEAKGIPEITREHAGQVGKFIADKDKTILLSDEDMKAAIDSRAEEVRALIEEADDTNLPQVQELKIRLSRLAGGIATIKVGGYTEAERAYQKMKIDDAVGACQSALQEGIVPGCGVTLRAIADELGTSTGEEILRDALREPHKHILRNAGFEDNGKDVNIFTGEEVEDMMEAGIVDPTKVLRCIIENSVSTAKTILTTECAIVDVPKEEKD